MKQLWKEKRVFCIIALLAVVIASVMVTISNFKYFIGVYDSLMEENPEMYVAIMEYKIYDISTMLEAVYASMNGIIKYLIIGILLIHGVWLWDEKNQNQRVFLQTIPIKKTDRVVFRIMLDVSTIVISIVASLLTAGCYIRAGAREIELPWLGRSMVGLGITDICYMMAFVGIIYFIETIFVKGEVKFIAAAASILLVPVSLKNFYEMSVYKENSLFYKIYGMFFLNSTGGSSYVRNTSKLVEMQYNEWSHRIFDIDYIYQGDKYYMEGVDLTCRIHDFSSLKVIGLPVAIYLIIGAALLIIAVSMTKRQDISKTGFYFDFGKTLTSIAIALLMVGLAFPFAYSPINAVMIVVSAVLVCVILNIAFRRKHKNTAIKI